MSSVARDNGGTRPEAGGAVSGERDAVPGKGRAVPAERGVVPGERGVVPTAGGAVSAAVDAARARRRLITTIKESLRAMSTQLSLLNHQVGARIELKDVDLNCLDLLARHGPVRVRPLRERGADLYRLYSGMNASLDEICAGYAATELELLSDIVHATTD